jgi:hypothetical protein
MKLRITNFSQIIYFLLFGTLPLCILEVLYDLSPFRMLRASEKGGFFNTCSGEKEE